MELLSLNAQRSTILSNNAEKNLFLGQIENKIKLQQQAIIENVTNNLNTLNLTKNEMDYRAEKLSIEISRLPRTELNMVSMQRKFNLSDAIYTFLLQKRSESAITMASNYPDYEILEPARSITRVILSPNTIMNYAVAVLFALLGPTIFIILRQFFNEKVSSVSDLKDLIDRPVIGKIFSNPNKSEAVVQEFPGSPIAEAFRNLRSAVLLKLKAESQKIILITSAQSQDGKSFVAFNLAASIASVGYNTIILDCDLRRPTLHEKFQEVNSTGVSTYLTNKASKDEIVRPTGLKNLSFIPAGPLLPNPSELIEAGALDDLFNYLKSKYEFIIIDTTPVGIVSDATLLMKYSTHTLLVCRNNFTRIDILSETINILNMIKLNDYDIIYNDVELKKSQYNRYHKYYSN